MVCYGISGVVNCFDPEHGRLVTWLQTKNSEAESHDINSVQSRTQHLRPRPFSIDDSEVILK